MTKELQKEILAEFLEKKLCSVSQLARFCNISRDPIIKLMNGRTTMTAKNWKKITIVMQTIEKWKEGEYE